MVNGQPSVGFDYDAVDETPQEERPVEALEVHEFLRRTIRYIRTKDRARLTVECLWIALGDASLEQKTMTAVAEDHGVTKAAISKRIKELRDDLKLPINANNKSPDAVRKYKNNHSPVRIQGPS